MKTLKLTAKNFKKSDGYWLDYIGDEIPRDFDGSIEIEGNLGYVRFNFLIVKGSIIAQAGSGIKAVGSIEAGDSIKAGYSIEAGYSIKAGGSIEAGGSIKAGYSIEAGDSIKAGYSIEAGYSIKAVGSIEAGYSIKAGGSIEAGLSITCKVLSARLRIFAGLCIWRLPTEEEKKIICERLEKGEVCYGELVLVKGGQR